MNLYSLILLSSLSWSQSQNVSDLEFFDRCFFLMTKSIPAANDPSLVKLKSKKISAPNACLEVLDRGRLGTNNLLANTNDKVSRAVLKTFNDFHGSWFQSRTHQGGGALATASALVRDIEEPWLRITRTLFVNNVPYKSIVQGTAAYKGQRVRTNRTAGNEFKSQAIFGYGTFTVGYQTKDHLSISYAGTTGAAVGDRLHALKVPDSRIVRLGDLIGIVPNTALNIPTSRFPNADTPRLPGELLGPLENNINMMRNFGGGILGSQVYIFNNANLNNGTRANMDIQINRRIAARAYEDLMCHELPMLNAEDVPASDIDPTSPQTFRRSASCMTCHSQIDPFADSYRNLVTTISSAGANANNTIGTPVEIVRALPLVGTLNIWALQPPRGKLYYREHQASKPTLKNVSSIEGLGAGIAESLDFYRCASKRYYRYFTGVDVTLGVISPPTPGGTNYERAKAKYDLDLKHQQFVMNAAKNLKNHQSLRTLISEILNTPTFKSRDFLSTKESR